MRLLALLILVIVTSSVMVGCGGDNDSGAEAPRSVLVDGEYSDERFIDMMVPHHAMAIDMAKDALEQSENEDIRALSERIVRGQTNEIEELKRLRLDAFGSRRTPDAMHPEAMANMGMRGHGDAGEHTGANTSSAGGHHGTEEPSASDEFDRRFLDDMIAHHAAAIQHASNALIHSDNMRLKAIAREIVDAQAREIGLMGDWRLDRWHHVL